nr:trypsin-like serine protease [Micromonospora sp. DSM 115978]
MNTRSRLARLVVSAALLVGAGLVGLPGPAGAATSTGGLDRPVTSDGSRVLVATKADVRGRSGFSGTGSPVDATATAPGGRSDTAVGMGIESIFGPDDRIRITPTTSFPARAVVQITRNGAAHCTGWLYGPDIVATAGHCVHSGGSGGAWFTGQLTVWPGRNGTAAPYGGCTARRLYSVVGWTVNGLEEHDYGAIKLNCTVGNTTGWFGYWWQTASLAGNSTLINGYPGDKPFGEQWRGDNVARTVAVSQANQIFYSNDTMGGMSGSPVYRYRVPGSAFCAGYCAMGIHAYGFPHLGFPHNTYNHGTRITEVRFNNMQAWRAAP